MLNFVHETPFGSFWFWALVTVQWIFHVSNIGGISFDAVEAAKNDAPDEFERTWAIQKTRRIGQINRIGPGTIFAISGLLAALVFLAVVAGWGMAQGIALIVAAQSFFWFRDNHILRTQGDTAARLAALHREKQLRLAAWVGFVLLLLTLWTVQGTRIG